MTTITSTTNFNCGFPIPSKNIGDNEANNNTIAILIKLLATKIVASNFFGFDKSFSTNTNRFEGESSSEGCKSVADKEKNATSAPEIRAEHNKSVNSMTILVICVILRRKIKSKLGGSISKIVRLIKH